MVMTKMSYMSSKKEVRFSTPENSKGDKGISTLSKKRYVEFEERIMNILGEGEDADAVMRTMREVMRFDPSVSRYSEEVRKALVESNKKWRLRKKANSAGGQNLREETS